MQLSSLVARVAIQRTLPGADYKVRVSRLQTLGFRMSAKGKGIACLLNLGVIAGQGQGVLGKLEKLKTTKSSVET